MILPVSANTLLEQPINKEKIIELSSSKLPSELAVEITADTIRYNQLKNFYEASGKAEASLPDRNAKLFAEVITYDTEKKLIEAFGDIKIIQGDSEIYGSYASFDVNSKTYDLDDPKLFITGVKLKARIVEAEHIQDDDEQYDNLVFKDGVVALDQPISLYSYAAPVRTRYSREIVRYYRNRQVNWDDLTDKSSLRYTAKKISIDNTRKTNNLTINGARVWLSKHLSVPSPFHITTTVGEASQTQFKGPIIGTRSRLGGFNIGPRFYKEVDRGVFSFVPVLQIGDGPEFGGGAIGTFNTPKDTTALMFGYGSLRNRFIARAHQDVIGKYVQVNALFNQFRQDSLLGTSQVGQLYEISSRFRKQLPFVDDRGLLFHLSAGWAADNVELFTGDRLQDLVFEREDGRPREEHEGFRTEIEASLYTQPVWRYGNELYNISLRGRGQGAFRFYDTGDVFSVARFGPALEARVDNLAFEVDYLFAAINGESPFLFDQFVDGSQSVIFDGDYKINKWFSVGTILTYNVDREEFVQNEVRTEVGPPDFKVRVGYDFIRNQADVGFNVLFGDPVKFDELNVRI